MFARTAVAIIAAASALTACTPDTEPTTANTTTATATAATKAAPAPKPATDTHDSDVACNPVPANLRDSLTALTGGKPIIDATTVAIPGVADSMLVAVKTDTDILSFVYTAPAAIQSITADTAEVSGMPVVKADTGDRLNSAALVEGCLND